MTKSDKPMPAFVFVLATMTPMISRSVPAVSALTIALPKMSRKTVHRTLCRDLSLTSKERIPQDRRRIKLSTGEELSRFAMQIMHYSLGL